jgi:hypothetical protein
VPYCGEWTIASDGAEKRRAFCLRCRSWGCPGCQPHRQKQLIAQAAGGSPSLFITITRRRADGITPKDAAKQLVNAWRKFRRHETTIRGLRDIPFFAVFEAHKSGWPHLHILVRLTWIDKQRLSSYMAEHIDSPVVDVKPIDSPGRVAGYVAKYIGKGPGKFGALKRYWQSKRYDIRQKHDKRKHLTCGEHFAVQRHCIITWAEHHADLGWLVQWLGISSAAAERPP